MLFSKRKNKQYQEQQWLHLKEKIWKLGIMCWAVELIFIFKTTWFAIEIDEFNHCDRSIDYEI